MTKNEIKLEAGDGIWLQHMLNGSKNGRFVLTQVGKEVNTLLDCGSSVLVLKMLRKLGLSIPDVMGGPDCWDKAWTCRW